jgi:hypothetical protein
LSPTFDQGEQPGPQLEDFYGLIQEGRVQPVGGRGEQHALQRLAGVEPCQRIVARRAQADEQRCSRRQPYVAHRRSSPEIESAKQERDERGRKIREFSPANRVAGHALPVTARTQPVREFAAKIGVAELNAAALVDQRFDLLFRVRAGERDEPPALKPGRASQVSEDVRRDLPHIECAAIRDAMRDRVEQRGPCAHGLHGTDERNAGEQIRLARLGERLRRAPATEVIHGGTNVEERSAAADDQGALPGIRDAERAPAVGVEFQRCAVDAKPPGLGVVDGGREYRVGREKPELFLRRSGSWKCFLCNAPGGEVC